MAASSLFSDICVSLLFSSLLLALSFISQSLLLLSLIDEHQLPALASSPTRHLVIRLSDPVDIIDSKGGRSWLSCFDGRSRKVSSHIDQRLLAVEEVRLLSLNLNDSDVLCCNHLGFICCNNHFLWVPWSLAVIRLCRLHRGGFRVPSF